MLQGIIGDIKRSVSGPYVLKKSISNNNIFLFIEQLY